SLLRAHSCSERRTVPANLAFDTTVAALIRLREWLVAKRITHGVMESTGSYWISIFNILEDHFVVVLANPEESRTERAIKRTASIPSAWQICYATTISAQAIYHPKRSVNCAI